MTYPVVTVATLAWRNLWRNYRRTLIMLAAITLGVWAMIFMSAMIRGMTDQVLINGLNVLPGEVQLHHPLQREGHISGRYRIAGMESLTGANFQDDRLAVFADLIALGDAANQRGQVLSLEHHDPVIDVEDKKRCGQSQGIDKKGSDKHVAIDAPGVDHLAPEPAFMLGSFEG